MAILPPEKTPDTPDADTATGPTFIPDGAPHQILRINLRFFNYGTDDKPHAASLLLSFMIGFLLLVLFGIGAFVESAWISEALKILGTAFTFTAGVAIGKSGGAKKD